ncbi:MAG: HEPN domain-containing protein [Acidobacteria bacterium]|nr:HEPN domain-containing protein [Acidobacteriota bacterium]
MPPEVSGPEDPREWLRRARSNLARARAGQTTADVLFEDLCFDAEQACEKAFKALLVLRGLAVPRTHAIAELLSRLEVARFDLPEAVKDAAGLTDYAVASRYPGAEPVTVDDYRLALRTAEGVVAWAAGYIHTRTK